ncbi:MAG: hypothetical protein AAFR81_02840 [Chloroflexota bacterium]
MLKTIFGELPAWARKSNPLLRYQLKRQGDDARPKVSTIIMWVLGLSVILVASVFYNTNGLQRPLQIPYSVEIWQILLYPLLGIQLVMRIAGVSMGVGAVSDERQRQTWDNLRATERGAELGVRSRWVAVFYRLRGLLLTVTIGRIILLGALLYEATSAQGAIIDLWTASALPSVSMQVGILVVSAFMTAFLVLPFTGLGIDIALGLWISTSVRNRAFAAILQLLVVLFRIGTTLGFFWLAWRFTNEELELSNELALFVLGANAVLGDLGLMLSQLQTSAQQWAFVPNSLFLGLVMLLIIILQGAFVSAILTRAGRTAETRE